MQRLENDCIDEKPNSHTNQRKQ